MKKDLNGDCKMLTAKEHRESIERFCTSGPFGHYDRGTTGHLLNSLTNYYKIPLQVVECLRIGNDGTINGWREGTFGRFKYLDGIETPLVSFNTHLGKNQPCYHDTEKNVMVPRFILHLSDGDLPCLQICPSKSTDGLFNFLCGLEEYEHLVDEQLDFNINAGTVLKSGFINPDSNNGFVVEFTKPSGVCAWLDYLNDHFTYPV